MEARRQRINDMDLVREALAGRDTAWRTIYDETCQPLYNFLCYQTGDRDRARDLLQETYVVALRRLEDFRGEGSLLSWLRTIALRRCLDWRRRVAVRLRKLSEYAIDISITRMQDVKEGPDVLGDSFEDALTRLSSKQRAALLLRELEDLPFRQVGAALGCSEATARVHHHRACRKMRRLLGDAPTLIPDGTVGGA